MRGCLQFTQNMDEVLRDDLAFVDLAADLGFEHNFPSFRFDPGLCCRAKRVVRSRRKEEEVTRCGRFAEAQMIRASCDVT